MERYPYGRGQSDQRNVRDARQPYGDYSQLANYSRQAQFADQQGPQDVYYANHQRNMSHPNPNSHMQSLPQSLPSRSAALNSGPVDMDLENQDDSPFVYRGPLTSRDQRAKDLNFSNVDEEDEFLYGSSSTNDAGRMPSTQSKKDFNKSLGSTSLNGSRAVMRDNSRSRSPTSFATTPCVGVRLPGTNPTHASRNNDWSDDEGDRQTKSIRSRNPFDSSVHVGGPPKDGPSNSVTDNIKLFSNRPDSGRSLSPPSRRFDTYPERAGPSAASKRSRSPDDFDQTARNAARPSSPQLKFFRGDNEGQALDPFERKIDQNLVRRNREEMDDLLLNKDSRAVVDTSKYQSHGSSGGMFDARKRQDDAYANFATCPTDRNGLKPIHALPKIARKSGTSSKPSEEGDPSAIVALRTEQARLEMKVEQLDKLHDKTAKRHAELQRTKHKRGVTDNDAELIENFKLCNDVKVQLDKLRLELGAINEKVARMTVVPKPERSNDDLNADVPPSSSRGFCSLDFAKPEPEIEENEETKNVFIDPGNHWCEKCDLFFESLTPYLSHLQSEDHWKNVDIASEPWRVRPKPRPGVEDATIASFKGSQFLMPIKGFYCTVCSCFVGNYRHAEDHMKTLKHNRSFGKFVILNPHYEKIYQTDKSKATVKAQKEEKRRVREDQEKEIREREEGQRRREEEIRRRDREQKQRLEQEAKSIQSVRDMLDDDFISRSGSSDKFSKVRSSSSKDGSHNKGSRKDEKQRIKTQDRRDNSMSRSSRGSSPDVKGLHKDPKLALKTEVIISRAEHRRAFKLYLALATEGGRKGLVCQIAPIDTSGIEIIQENVKVEDRKPTAEELKMNMARNVINATVTFDDENSNENFNLQSVVNSSTVNESVGLNKNVTEGFIASTSPEIVTKKETKSAAPDETFLRVFNMLDGGEKSPPRPDSTSSNEKALPESDKASISSTTAVTEAVSTDETTSALVTSSPTKVERKNSRDDIITGQDVQLKPMNEKRNSSLDTGAADEEEDGAMEVSRSEKTSEHLFDEIFTAPSELKEQDVPDDTFRESTHFPTLGLDDLAKTPPYAATQSSDTEASTSK